MISFLKFYKTKVLSIDNQHASRNVYLIAGDFETSSASTDGAFCNLSEGALDRYRDSLEGASIASKITRFENFSSRSSPGRCPKTVRAAPPPTIPRPANLPPPNIYYETTVKKKPPRPPSPQKIDDDVLELDKVLKELQEFSAHLDKNIPGWLKIFKRFFRKYRIE